MGGGAGAARRRRAGGTGTGGRGGGGALGRGGGCIGGGPRDQHVVVQGAEERPGLWVLPAAEGHHARLLRLHHLRVKVVPLQGADGVGAFHVPVHGEAGVAGVAARALVLAPRLE